MYNFSASLYCFKNKFELGACQEKRQIWKRSRCTRGDSLGAYGGTLYPMVFTRRLKLLKGFCEAVGQWVLSFPSKARSHSSPVLASVNAAWLTCLFSSSFLLETKTRKQQITESWCEMLLYSFLKLATKFWRWYCQHWWFFLFRDVLFSRKMSFLSVWKRAPSVLYVTGSCSMTKLHRILLLTWCFAVPKSAINMSA